MLGKIDWNAGVRKDSIHKCYTVSLAWKKICKKKSSVGFIIYSCHLDEQLP